MRRRDRLGELRGTSADVEILDLVEEIEDVSCRC